MVRIRKKTSNRMTTAHRAKIKNKARETKKKNKKEAKKNPNLHKKKKKKDRGIPNSFPFKEQILAEVAEARRAALEEKQRKKEQAGLKPTSVDPSTSEEGISNVPIAVTSITTATHSMELEAPSLIDTSIPHTAAAIEAADLVLHLLDSRDPLSFQNTFIKESVGDKPFFYILNKIDLTPREAISAWSIHLRKQHPTFLFRSATAQIPLEQAQNLPQTPGTIPLSGKVKIKISNDDAIGRDALLESLSTIANYLKKDELTVAFIQVGKSAFINSLLKSNVVAVYNPLSARDKDSTSPTTTPNPQRVTLIHKKKTFQLVDTPGLSFIPPSQPQSEEEKETRIARDILLRNRGNISKIKDPLSAALYILSRAVMDDLIVLYNLPAVQGGDYDGFLSSLARKEGALQKKGAVIDFQGAARALVRDWKTGQLAHYAFPPRDDVEVSAKGSTRLDFSSIYAKTDEKILAQVFPRKELRRQKGSIVQLKNGVLDERKIDLEAVYVPAEDSEDEEMEGDFDEGDEEDVDDIEDDEDEDANIEADEEGSEEDDDTEEESLEEPPEEPPINLSGKQKREAARSHRQVGKSASKGSEKKVSFAPYTKAGGKGGKKRR